MKVVTRSYSVWCSSRSCPVLPATAEPFPGCGRAGRCSPPWDGASWALPWQDLPHHGEMCWALPEGPGSCVSVRLSGLEAALSLQLHEAAAVRTRPSVARWCLSAHQPQRVCGNSSCLRLGERGAHSHHPRSDVDVNHSEAAEAGQVTLLAPPGVQWGSRSVPSFLLIPAAFG